MPPLNLNNTTQIDKCQLSIGNPRMGFMDIKIPLPGNGEANFRIKIEPEIAQAIKHIGSLTVYVKEEATEEPENRSFASGNLDSRG